MNVHAVCVVRDQKEKEKTGGRHCANVVDPIGLAADRRLFRFWGDRPLRSASQLAS